MTKSKMYSLARSEATQTYMRLPSGPERSRLERKARVLGRLQLRAAAQALKERYSSVPFYAERAKNNPQYWRDLALSAVHA